MQMLLLMEGKTVEATVYNVHYNKSLKLKQPFKQIYISNLLSESFLYSTRVSGKWSRCLSASDHFVMNWYVEKGVDTLICIC